MLCAVAKVRLHGTLNGEVEFVRSSTECGVDSRLIVCRLHSEKFLIGRDGQFIERYSSRATPEKMEADIVKALEQPAKL